MDAWTIYWITRLDGIQQFLGITAGLLITEGILGIVFGFMEESRAARRWGIAGVAVAVLLGVGAVLCPSSRDAMAIAVIPKIASPENIDAASSEAKEIYGMAKEWLKREMEPEKK